MINYSFAQDLSEKGWVPDALVRQGIRALLKKRLDEVHAGDLEIANRRQAELLEEMAESPIALMTEAANEQHYELPTGFFEAVLGKYRKYSCGYWPEGVQTLDQAESAALELTCRHADLRNGQRILELGCGWGSLSLWMAAAYPGSEIVAVSNAVAQREYIERQAQGRGLNNLKVITEDMNCFEADGQYDRVVSVEMFEHMRNWSLLLSRVARWLAPGGKFFMHVFAHRAVPYLFEQRNETDWMSRHFFSGGMMPSIDLPLFFQQDLSLERRWLLNGQHYASTAEAWLEKMDDQKGSLWSLFEHTYGRDFARLWWMRWRMFFMACAELFAYDGGEQWLVGHYRFERREGWPE